MTPSSTNADDTSDPNFLVCASCGAKAAPTWSFCRSCQSSLDDAETPSEAGYGVQVDEARGMGASGCPKCGHADAEVDQVATTGTGLSRLFDVQTRQFNVVTCTNCGYTEFYRGQDTGVVIDLFLG